MGELQDLNVQYRMLHEGSDHIIGKASVSHLSLEDMLVDLPEVVNLRKRSARRMFDLSVSVTALLLVPLAPLLLPLARLPIGATFRKLKELPSVLAGRRALVGCRTEDVALLPASWNLPPGVFSITNTLRTGELEKEDLIRAYWFYVTHQSPGLDADIMIRSLREARPGRGH
jgi:hypothetical protein